MADIEHRAERLGKIFGTEPGILLKIPKDLTVLKELVEAHIALGCNPEINGEIPPKNSEPIRDEVLSLVGQRSGLSHAGYPIVRQKPCPHSGRYDSSYLHSDVWSGNPPGCIVMFPIMGDFTNGGVEFFKPTMNFNRLNEQYPSYDSVPDFRPEYLGKMEPGFMYVLDAFCLHRTMLGEKRISVDMRFAIDGKFLQDSKRNGHYRPIWDDIEGRN